MASEYEIDDRSGKQQLIKYHIIESNDMKGKPVLQAVAAIEKKTYDVNNLAAIIKAVLMIIASVMAVVGIGKVSFWNVLTSPLKYYRLITGIIKQISIIGDSYVIAWEEIKDFKVNEIDDLLRKMLSGFKEAFGQLE